MRTAAAVTLCHPPWQEEATSLPTEEASELWPTFSRDLPSNRSRSAVHLHQHHMERPPNQKISKKISGSQNRPSPLGKVTFFSRRGAVVRCRAAPDKNRYLARIRAEFKENERGFFSRIRTIEMH